MNMKIGSEVRFLNEVGGGIITRINNNLIWVKTKDGFEIPANKEEVVVIADMNIKSETQPENVKKDEPKMYVSNNSYNYSEREEEISFQEMDIEFKKHTLDLTLAFVLKDSVKWENSDIDLFLVNDSEFEVFFNLLSKYNSSYANIDSSILESNINYHISTFNRTQLNELTEFRIQIIAYKKNIYLPIKPFENIIKLKATKFFKQNSFVENDYFEEKAIVFKLNSLTENIGDDRNEIDKELLQEIVNKNLLFQPKPFQEKKLEKTNVSEIEEVDLHIEKLVDDYKKMSNAEMLLTQISHFRSKLDNAIFRNIKKIVFIHGIGNGTLKHELRKILDEHYTDIKYQDASFKEYGYGATMVFIK